MSKNGCELSTNYFLKNVLETVNSKKTAFTSDADNRDVFQDDKITLVDRFFLHEHYLAIDVNL